MGGAVDHRHLHVPGSTIVHRLPAAAKVLGLFVFVVAVALTPRRAVPVFGIDALVLGAVVAVARLPIRLVVSRLMVIAPFVVMAILVPFVAEGGEQVEVLGRSLSVDGLWATWSIIAKASLGATASIVLAATTPIPDVLAGLSKLKVPWVLVAIVSFMFRYLDLLVDQLQRMRRAMVSRCHDPRWLWQARPIASSAGALFVRSYERGERIHQAMAARGYTGAMPALSDEHVDSREYVAAAIPGALAAIALATAMMIG